MSEKNAATNLNVCLRVNCALMFINLKKNVYSIVHFALFYEKLHQLLQILITSNVFDKF